MTYRFVPGEGAVITWGLWTVRQGALGHFGSREGVLPLMVAQNPGA